MKTKPRKKQFRSPAFELLYEDNFLLVVNKMAGVLSVPTESKSRTRRNELTLIGEVKRYLSVKSGRDLGATPIHRLDRDTSGVLVVAKSRTLALRIKKQFEAKKPEREYVAIVKGRVEEMRGTFRSYLATDDDLNQYSTRNAKAGKLAITHYEVVARTPEATHVRVKLETGRRNQIRVHFAEAGHPVLGETRYAVKLAEHKGWRHPRLALHAAKLGFYHPALRRELRFEAALPGELGRFLEEFGLVRK